ncbi:MAG: hypothetical protein NZ693_06160 [Thermoflexales bacterium]|nr:hypothetical protein [Thermoflexales bacterium]
MTNRFASGAARPQQPLTAQVIDVGREPALKSALLAGRLPSLSGPFIYHDPAKQLALIYMPIELGLSDFEQQRIIGQLTQTVMRSLPEDAPRAYLLQPRIFFTFQSLVEAVLQADGISQEEIRAQQAKADLLRDLLRSTDEASLVTKIKANDDKIDATFFDLVVGTIENALQSGNERVAQAVEAIRQMLIEHSTYGRQVGARTRIINEFRKAPTREGLLQALISAPDAETREALIALGRSLLDYLFFQQLSARIDAAAGEEQQRLIALRKEIQTIRDQLDAAARAAVQAKAQLIQQIALSKDPLATARQHADEIDETLLSILESNLQATQQRGDREAFQALERAYDAVMQVIAERQPPEIRLVNLLLSARYPDETEKLLDEVKDKLDERFIGLLAQFADQLAQEDRTDLSAKLTKVMVQARQILPKYDPAKDSAVASTPTQPPQKPIIEIARR